MAATHDQHQRNAGFAARDIRAGFVACLPISVGVAAFGAVLGVLAGAKGVSLGELMAMGATVFAGAAQFVAIDLWAGAVPVADIVVATAIVNLRYVLICASLRPVVAGLSLRRRLLAVHLVADENWALTMAARDGRGTPGYLLGGGLALFAVWLGSGAAGHVLGAGLARPETLGLDFAFTAAFLALALGLWRGRGDVLPWAVAAAAAIVCAELVPGNWYIVVGSLSGAVVAAFMPGAENHA